MHVVTQQHTSRAPPSELGIHMDFLFAPSHAKLASVRSACTRTGSGWLLAAALTWLRLE